MRLLPEDMQFIEGIQNEISEHCAVPLELPPDRIAKHIQKAAKWFYRWHPLAIQEGKYLIKASDICSARTSEDQFTPGTVATITMPESIKYVYEITKSVRGTTAGRNISTFLRNPLLSVNRFSTYTSSGGMSTGVQPGHSRDINLMETTIALYEYSIYNQISERGRGVHFDFNEYTNQINFLSDVDADVMINVGYRVPITKLYAEEYFENYVIGSCLKSLSTILGTYDFKLIGNVSINYDQLRTQGEEMLNEAKEDVKGLNNNGFIMTR